MSLSTTFVRLLMLGFLLVSLFTVRPVPRAEILNSNVRAYVFLVLLALAIHFSSKISRNWLNAESFFLLGLLVVGLQWPLMVVVGGEIALQGSPIEQFKPYFVFSSWLASTGIVSSLLGMELATLRWGKTVPKPDKAMPSHGSGYTFYIGLSATFFLLFFATVGTEFLSGVYRGARNWSSVSGYFYLAFHASLLLATLEVVSRIRSRFSGSGIGHLRAAPFSYVFLVLVYTLSFWTLGDRGGPLSLLICLIALYVQSVRRITFAKALLIVVIGILAMAVIREGRNNEDLSNSLIAGYHNITIEQGGDLTAELATSFRTIQASSQAIDALGHHYWGSSMVPNLLATFPFGGTLVREMLGGEFTVPSTSALMTLWINGPHSVSGAGSSIFADAYLNFGVIGVVVICLAYGYLIRNVSVETAETVSGMTRKALVLTLASLSLYISRDSVFGPLKLFIWLVVIQVSYLTLVRRRAFLRSAL